MLKAQKLREYLEVKQKGRSNDHQNEVIEYFMKSNLDVLFLQGTDDVTWGDELVH
jgi:hypothetical protein